LTDPVLTFSINATFWISRSEHEKTYGHQIDIELALKVSRLRRPKGGEKRVRRLS
jgi:hypothetical protein